jgi:sugar phosphate isomerase/epimerase
MPKIGLKIDYNYKDNPYYQELYGNRDVLEYLYSVGIRTLESAIGPEIHKDAFFEHINQCIKAGFLVSLHPYTEMGEANPAGFSPEKENACMIFHESVFRLADRAAQLQQFETTVNIHPAADHIKINRNNLLERSIAFFKWAHHWCKANAPMARPVAELQIRPNREESIQRLGDCYSELLEITRHTDTGICWDFGHAYMNSLRFADPLFPPTELIRHITHVHCHDVSVYDHEPLEFGNVPWEHFLDILIEAGFDGAIILEVLPQRFLSAQGLRSLINSISAIKRKI